MYFEEIGKVTKYEKFPNIHFEQASFSNGHWHQLMHLAFLVLITAIIRGGQERRKIGKNIFF
jgi:hypothetical protein